MERPRSLPPIPHQILDILRALLPFIFTSIFPTTAAGVPTAPQRGISTHIRCPLL